MANNPVPRDKPRVYAFSPGRLVLLVCMVLTLMALCLMLGIRIEKYQQSGDIAVVESAAGASEKASSKHVKPASKSEPVAGSGKTASSRKPAAKAATAPAAPKTQPGKTTQASKPKAPEPAKKPGPKKAVATTAAKTSPKKPVPTRQEKPEPRGHYAVQVEASQDKSRAGLQVDLLKKNGYDAYLEPIDLGAKGRFFRVMVGPYGTEAEAEKVRTDLIRDSRFSESYIRYLP